MNESVRSDAELTAVLESVRQAFKVGEFQKVVDLSAEFGDIGKLRSGLRIEAIALIARAFIELGDKRSARAILKRVGSKPLQSSRLCAHLAIVYIELRDFAVAEEMCRTAATLRSGETPS